MKVAINGFGRIGRSVFRILNSTEDVDVVAINDIADNEALAYLLRNDTVMGRFPDKVEVAGDMLRTSSQTVQMTEISDPRELPWEKLGVEHVIEATGLFSRVPRIRDRDAHGSCRLERTDLCVSDSKNGIVRQQ